MTQQTHGLEPLAPPPSVKALPPRFHAPLTLTFPARDAVSPVPEIFSGLAGRLASVPPDRLMLPEAFNPPEPRPVEPKDETPALVLDPATLPPPAGAEPPPPPPEMEEIPPYVPPPEVVVESIAPPPPPERVPPMAS